jgi:hypothetical protein
MASVPQGYLKARTEMQPTEVSLRKSRGLPGSRDHFDVPPTGNEGKTQHWKDSKLFLRWHALCPCPTSITDGTIHNFSRNYCTANQTGYICTPPPKIPQAQFHTFHTAREAEGTAKRQPLGAPQKKSQGLPGAGENRPGDPPNIPGPGDSPAFF